MVSLLREKHLKRFNTKSVQHKFSTGLKLNRNQILFVTSFLIVKASNVKNTVFSLGLRPMELKLQADPSVTPKRDISPGGRKNYSINLISVKDCGFFPPEKN
jgi:hypothetical protein